ncbi:MAG: SPOR domain-containing protein [Gemmatimonadaceae bacterium]
MSKIFWFIAATVAFATVAPAQETAIVNPVYRRAQTLVNDGNATAGRALVDSMVAAAVSGSNEYAEAVFWRAVLASTAADAEMDYRRIVVDYAKSPRVEDALIRLAQLEIARANYDGALRHLNLLITDHPESPARGRAGYWIARALFDKNDVQGGCVATADALTRTSEGDAELRNQINYLNQRCAGVSLTPPVAATVSQTPNSAPPADTGSSVGPTAKVLTAPSPEKTAVNTPVVDRTAVAVRPPISEIPTPISKPRPVAPSTVDKVPVLEPPAKATKPNSLAVWSVQIAAYNAKAQAAAMVAKLKKTGYEARVDGTVAPFRVRIGKYATQSQASAVQRSLKSKQITGIVVQAETQ